MDCWTVNDPALTRPTPSATRLLKDSNNEPMGRLPRLASGGPRRSESEIEVCISSYCDLARFGGLALTPHGHAVMPVGNIAHGVITGRRGVRVVRCGHHDDISNHLRMHIAQQRNDTGPIEAELAIVAGRPSAQVVCQALVARNRWPAYIVRHRVAVLEYHRRTLRYDQDPRFKALAVLINLIWDSGRGKGLASNAIHIHNARLRHRRNLSSQGTRVCSGGNNRDENQCEENVPLDHD